MKEVNAREYLSMLHSLVQEGHEVSMIITGSSMAPFLIHQRDIIYFKQPDRSLHKGDMVFFQRQSGQYVMHRIWKVKTDGYYMVGDGQTVIEGPIGRDQIFALVTKVKRKGNWIRPGDFWWEFFAHIWINFIPVRCLATYLYACWKRIKCFDIFRNKQ